MIAGSPVVALKPEEPTRKWRASRNPRLLGGPIAEDIVCYYVV